MREREAPRNSDRDRPVRQAVGPAPRRDDPSARGAPPQRRFTFTPPSAADRKKAASRSGGLYDSVLLPDLLTFKPKEGDYTIRILPNMAKGAKHYGIDVYVHYGVGADEGQYLCPKKMSPPGEPPSPCPICDEVDELRRAGDEETAKELRPNIQTLVWVIDRDAQDEGPKLFLMPFFKFDKVVCGQCQDKRTGETLWPEDPVNGYDVEFGRGGKGRNVQYSGPHLARHSTPLSDNPDEEQDWLGYVSDHPLRECLNLYDFEYLTNILAGGRSKSRQREEDGDQPRSRDSRREPEPERRSFRDREGPANEEPPPRERESNQRRRQIDDAVNEPPSRRRQVIDDPDEPLDEEATEGGEQNGESRHGGREEDRHPQEGQQGQARGAPPRSRTQVPVSRRRQLPDEGDRYQEADIPF